MPIQDSNKNIVRGVIVSSDIFTRKEIEKVNTKVNETFGVKPTVQKSHTTLMGEPTDSFETNQAVWNIESLPKLFETLKHTCDEKRFECNVELMERYVQSFQVRGYESPRLPFYVLMAVITLNEDALNLCEDLRKDLWQVALPIRLFVESLDGLTKCMGNFSPRSTAITQLWVKVDKKHLSKMRKTEIALVSKDRETFEVLEQRKKLSEKLRRLEPFDLSAPVGDVHSHILNGENVVIVLGHMAQLALGGLRTPYISYLSYDEKLLQSNLADLPNTSIEVSVYSLEGIVWQGYAYLIALISMSIYLSYIAFERAKIDDQLSILRDSILTKSSKHTIDQHLSELNNYGTQISSLLHILGIFSRQWKRAIRQISQGKDYFALEVPIETSNLLGHIITRSNLKSKGYLGTLANQILLTLENNRESLAKQESEVASLRMHISDVVNLRISKSNEDLQKSMKRLTKISVFIAIMALSVSIISGWYSIQIASLDYQRTHPDGEYFVNVDFLGYDYLTNNDAFRITITYQGRGESRFLRLSIGVVGANPTVVSKGNTEVMEPDIILARNYVDGLIGWVDYNIQRFAFVNRTRLSILDFSSDVSVRIIDNT